jgi:hypothetical protein
MSMGEELQECNGCYIRHYSCLLQLNDIKRKDCPCLKCLIKGVCKIKCDDRIKLWNNTKPVDLTKLV